MARPKTVRRRVHQCSLTVRQISMRRNIFVYAEIDMPFAGPRSVISVQNAEYLRVVQRIAVAMKAAEPDRLAHAPSTHASIPYASLQGLGYPIQTR
jgi:hypothetical protein